MYLHLGQNTVIRQKNIVGIFDLDSITVTERGREYIKKAEKKGRVIYASMELPKSCVLWKEGKKERLYISQLSAATLQKRMTKPFL